MQEYLTSRNLILAGGVLTSAFGLYFYSSKLQDEEKKTISKSNQKLYTQLIRNYKKRYNKIIGDLDNFARLLAQDVNLCLKAGSPQEKLERIADKIEKFQDKATFTGQLLHEDLNVYSFSNLDFDSTLTLTLTFYIRSIELAVPFLENCKGNPNDINAVITSIGSGLFESPQKLKQSNTSLIKMCANATVIHGVNVLLKQMIKNQDISNDEKKTMLTRSAADFQVANGLLKMRKYRGFINELMRGITEEVSIESSPILKGAVQMIKDVLNSESDFTDAYLKVMNLFDSPYNEEEKKYDEIVYNKEMIRQEIINFLPHTVLGVQHFTQHIKAHALTTFDGKILIDLRFLTNLNRSGMEQMEKRLIAINIILILHELVHQKRILMSSQGKYFQKTPQKNGRVEIKESGRYMEKQAFGHIMDRCIEGISDKLVELITDLNAWNTRFDEIKNEIAVVQELKKSKGPTEGIRDIESTFEALQEEEEENYLCAQALFRDNTVRFY